MLRRLFLDPDTALAVAFPLLVIVQFFHYPLQIDIPAGIREALPLVSSQTFEVTR